MPTLPGTMRIVNDVEYENSDRFTGAASFFKYKPGPVTAVNSIWDGEGLRWSCVEGQSLPGPAKMDGNCHIVFRPSVPVRELYRRMVDRGVTQHWLFVSGHRSAEIERLCGVLGVRFLP